MNEAERRQPVLVGGYRYVVGGGRFECLGPVDAIPISPSESPYEYVEALRVRQDGKCSCGRCER